MQWVVDWISQNADLVGILLVTLVPFAVALIGILTSYLLAPRVPNPRKVRRYEAGNPPLAEPKAPLPMQYIGYALLLTSLEPILVFTILITVGTWSAALPLIIIAVILTVVGVAYSLRYVKDIKEWGA